MGELTQKYLVLTGRGRIKNKTKELMQLDFENEIADVFGQVLLLARHSGVDLNKVLHDKRYVYLQ